MGVGTVGVDDHETLWTIQPVSVWVQVEREGKARVDRRFTTYSSESIWQYDWLASQLARRIDGYSAGYPWWAYCKKPDLRSHRHNQTGEQVRIGFRPSVGWIRFPIWMWDTIYSGRYLARSYDEFVEWTQEVQAAVPDEETWPLPEPWRDRLEKSWERLFEPHTDSSCWLLNCYLEDPRLDDYWPIGFESGSCEAVGDTLRASEVVDVSFFGK